MNGKSVYLDSSALVKRYLAEEGTETVDALYHRAEAREVQLAFSLWNVGEVVRAIAKAERLRWISKEQAGAATWAFLRESLKLRDPRRDSRVVEEVHAFAARCLNRSDPVLAGNL